MRRLLYWIGGGLLILLLVLLLVPYLFQDKIHALLQEQINKNLYAHVEYKTVSLSFFRHFPVLTLRLEGLSVANKAPFAGDTLLTCRTLDVGINVWKALQGEISITRFYLVEPKIYAKVLSNGRANWDITLADTTQAPEKPADTATSAFRLSLRRYEIQNAQVTYLDSSLGLYVQLVGLSHQGKGDLTQDETILETETQIEKLFLTYDQTTYFSGQRVEAGIDLDISFPSSRYTLRRGKLRINALPLELSGSVTLPDSLTTLLDVRFSAPEASLKELLSLIPAAFRKGYESLSTEGTLRLEGFIQGVLRDSLLPAFGLNLSVENGRVQYKDLPKQIENLQVRLKVESPASTIESLRVRLDTFFLRAGGSRLQARWTSTGLSRMLIQAALQGEGNLSEFATALPLGYELRGAFKADVQLSGIYAEKQLPSVAGLFTLRDGFIKAADFPTPLENISIDFTAESPGGLPARTVANLKRFFAQVAHDPIEASLQVQNLDALNYTFTAKGRINLDTWMRIFPIESTRVAGLLTFDLSGQGNREALEKHDYTRLPTQGTLTIQKLAYQSPDLPQGLTIDQATFSFSPRYAVLSGYKGTVGRSDIALEGKLENYLGYVLRDEKIIGSLALRSRRLDLNEWMVSDSTQAQATATDTSSALEVVVLPANVDFTFQAEVGELLYEKMVFRNARGKVILRDQVLRLEGFEMEGLGGRIALAGSYAAPDKQNARWDMQFRLEQVEIEELARHFTTMRRLAPIVASTQGRVNLSLSASSRLKPDFMPDLSTLSGSGLAEVLQAVVKGSASVNALSSAAKMPQLSTLQVHNTQIRFKLQNGELQVEPFSFSAGEYKMEVGGITRLDQTIAYTIGMEVPAGWAQGFLQAAGLPLQAPGKVQLVADLGGTVKQPKVLGIRPKGSTETVKEALTSKIEEEKARLEAEAKRKKDSLEAALRRKEDSLRQALEQKRRAEEERLRREAEERRRREEERLRQEAERKKREEEERLKRQLEEEKKKKEEELKKKLPFPR